jgi:hypothetical protein
MKDVNDQEILVEKIGKTGYPLSKIIRDIQKAGFKVEKTYRIRLRQFHSK